MSIDKLGGIQNNPEIRNACRTNNKTADNETVFFTKTTKNITASMRKVFNEDIKQSPLDDRVPNKSTLNKMEFNALFRDKNGGITYQNKNGDTIRISNFEAEIATGMEGATQVEFKSKDGKTSNTVLYDPDGNPLKGTLTVINKDGRQVKYEYEYDLNGNKNLIRYTSDISPKFHAH